MSKHGIKGELGLALLQAIAKKEGKPIPYYFISSGKIRKYWINEDGKFRPDCDPKWHNRFNYLAGNVTRYSNYWFAYAALLGGDNGNGE
jgi:hypothetical protein